ncbi:MAG: hypothetical protein ACJAWV_004046 [Flammeovirgaceae bacterium]|jgi:hypothetical protein
MKALKLFILLTSFIALVSCDDDNSPINVVDEALTQLKAETFFVDLEVDGEAMRYEVDGSQNAFDNNNSFYRLESSSGWSCQNNEVVSGRKSIEMIGYNQSNREFDFSLDIKRQIRKTELNGTDKYDYLDKTLNPAKGFGYPNDKDGYPSYVKDGSVEIGNEGVSEVYIDLSFLDKNSGTKRLVSSYLSDQPTNASFKITKIIKLEEEIGTAEYNKFKYIIEGEFSCDMYYSDFSSTKVSITKGSFRLPYTQQNTESLLNFCN